MVCRHGGWRNSRKNSGYREFDPGIRYYDDALYALAPADQGTQTQNVGTTPAKDQRPIYGKQ